MIEEAYVSFETAKLLKEKGFDVVCITKYRPDGNVGFWTTDDLEAPTQQMATRWLREVHNIHIVAFCPVVDIDAKELGVTYNVVISMLDNDCLAADTDIEDVEYKSYEDAIESDIQYCLKHLIK